MDVFHVFKLYKSSSATVLAASSDRLRPHGPVQVSTLIKSSSAAVLAASSDCLRPHESVQVSQTHVALTGLTRQQVLQLMMTWLNRTNGTKSCNASHYFHILSNCWKNMKIGPCSGKVHCYLGYLLKGDCQSHVIFRWGNLFNKVYVGYLINSKSSVTFSKNLETFFQNNFLKICL